MKFEQIKTYLVGVLKGWFTNKTVLDKLSVNESNFLLYDGSQVAGTGVLYRDETVLFEGGATTATLIDSIENYEYVDIYINEPTALQMGYPEVRTVKVSHIIPYYGGTWMTTIPSGGSDAWTNCLLGMYFVDATTLAINWNGSTRQIAKVVGINYKAKQSYSLEEQIVGTWIDGKPLYQKTIQTTSPSVINTETLTYIADDIDTCYVQDGLILYSDTLTMPLNYGNYLTCAIKNKQIHLYSNNTSYCNKSSLVTVRYTKTTDAATITI